MAERGVQVVPDEDCGGPPGDEELVAVAGGGDASDGGDTEMLRERMGDWAPSVSRSSCRVQP